MNHINLKSKIEKYPNIKSFVDFTPQLWPQPKNQTKILHFAFLSSVEFDLLKMYHSDLFPYDQYKYYNLQGCIKEVEGELYYNYVMSTHTMVYDISFLVYCNTTKIREGNQSYGSYGITKHEEKLLWMRYSIVTFNGQKLYVVYSDFYKDKYYQTPDNNIDIELIKLFLQVNFPNDKQDSFSYRLYDNYSDTKDLITQWSSLLPLMTKTPGKDYLIDLPGAVVTWLNPKEDNEMFIQAIRNEYILSRI